ncbi:PREDICTED: ubiquinone biosynthesis O-methyltransferase, mitochondrial-like isoform X2 [Bactrocera latifrons]|uniref:Ubiquinone biosynthesis O-methyltransferase, mitochondrial n=1 Tax=Bactrocera latifrons TaxID=174628 RepID=A0A0K8TV91_BACLA|nr:PREDICTED: ubiquinone biosynthesis O-methyltransferase, mitochondrial-like isoform X2 [Bactrocera latifrons]
MSLRTVTAVPSLLQQQRYFLQNTFGYLRYAQTSSNTTYTSTPTASTAKKNEEFQQFNDSTQKEIDHHARLSATWWDLNGPLHGLHKLNDLRVPFVIHGLVAQSIVDKNFRNTAATNLRNAGKVLQNKKILEVGCGGGILTEALARLNANVTGVDLGADVIMTAEKHLNEHSPELVERITYKTESIAEHANDHANHYDAIVCSEVLEHIDEKEAFLKDCVRAIKPGGSIFITTLNKTVLQWFIGIILGEYVFGVAPKNTHHWSKLIAPQDVQRILTALNCETVSLNGLTYNVFYRRWRWINTTKLCYALHAIKAA